MKFDKKIYFISGIDTDAGKSYAVAMLAKMVGEGVATQKFIQTGQDPTLISEDILTHRRLQGIEVLPEDLDKTTCPLIFKLPSSPHLAAREEGVEIDTKIIEQATQKLLQKYKTILIEGAGGLTVPVREDYLTADYIADHKLPLILVVSAKLGSLNHAFLSLEYCKNRKLDLVAVVYNTAIATNDIITRDTQKMIEKYLSQNCPQADFLVMPKL